MKRGEVWTASGGPDYAGKPRPVLILQAPEFDARNSVTVCLITTNPANLPLFRIPIAPNTENGLRGDSRVMVDKIMTIATAKFGNRVGRLSEDEMNRVSRAVAIFLGVVG